MSSASRGSLNHLYSAADSQASTRLLAQLRDGDAVVLLGPAVTLARPGNAELGRWTDLAVSLYALDEDLAAYAVQTPDPAVRAISYADWVALSERFPTQTLWR